MKEAYNSMGTPAGARTTASPRLWLSNFRQPANLASSTLRSSWARPPSGSTWRGCRRQGRARATITSLLVGADGRPMMGSSPVRVYDLSKASSKRVVAEMLVHAPVEQVWEVLTDYERLPSFVPNLEACSRVPCPKPGRVWVAQRACSQSLLWRLEAEAVLEIEEVAAAGVLGRREARFSLVEGDFKELSGRWVMEPAGMACTLRYDVTLVPKLPLPLTIVSHVVRAGLPSNILAVAQRAEQLAAERLKPASIASWVGLEDDAPLPGQQDQPLQQQQQQQAQQAVCPVGSEAVGPACVFSIPPPGGTQGDPVAGQQQQQLEEQQQWQQQQQTQQQQPQQQQQSALAARGWDLGDDALPTSGPFWSRKSKFAASAPLTAAAQRRRMGQPDPLPLGLAGVGAGNARSTYLGVSSVPLPLPPAGSWGDLDQDLQARMNESQRQKELLQASYPAFGLQRPGRAAAAAAAAGTEAGNGNGSSAAAAAAVAGGRRGVQNGSAPVPGGAAAGMGAGAAVIPASAELEVHLRRLDGLDYLHRRAVAAITIDAPPEEVWRVLTDYDRLADFVPNLAVSQRIALPRGAPPNVVRLRQVGYKRVLYMSMHAESVLDLVEKPCSEIQFRQVAGDFERFQGKWMLQEVLPVSAEEQDWSGPQTQLKYAVEVVIPRSTRLLGVMEPFLERCVFEDVPANLAALKRRVEGLQAERERAAKYELASDLEEAGQADKAAALRRRIEVPRPREMYEDFSVLAAELERCFGADKVLPGRTQLREMNRYDLEKAIAAHGGPAAVAQALGWPSWGGRKRNRKPRGYWDSPANLRAAIDEFIAEQGLEPGVMPVKNQLVRAGRYDIARAVEKWGGVAEVAAQLGYEVGLDGKERWYGHLRSVAREKGLAGNEGLFEEAAKTYAKRGSAATVATSSCDGDADGSDSLSSMDLDAFTRAAVLRDSGNGSSGSWDLTSPRGGPESVGSGGRENGAAGRAPPTPPQPAAPQRQPPAGRPAPGSGKAGRAPRSGPAGGGMGSIRREIDSW